MRCWSASLLCHLTHWTPDTEPPREQEGRLTQMWNLRFIPFILATDKSFKNKTQGVIFSREPATLWCGNNITGRENRSIRSGCVQLTDNWTRRPIISLRLDFSPQFHEHLLTLKNASSSSKTFEEQNFAKGLVGIHKPSFQYANKHEWMN